MSASARHLRLEVRRRPHQHRRCTQRGGARWRRRWCRASTRGRRPRAALCDPGTERAHRLYDAIAFVLVSSAASPLEPSASTPASPVAHESIDVRARSRGYQRRRWNQMSWGAAETRRRVRGAYVTPRLSTASAGVKPPTASPDSQVPQIDQMQSERHEEQRRAGASIHGASLSTRTLAASCSIVPQLALAFWKAETEIGDRRFGDEQRRHEQHDLDGEKSAGRRQQMQSRRSGPAPMARAASA